MELTAGERAVLERYRAKTDIAGGARAGYMLRKLAIASGLEDDALDLDAALAALRERGLVTANDGGELVYLTEDGAAALSAL